MSTMALSNGLERRFHIHTSNAVICQYGWSWKELGQGSWKELKMNLFGDYFWTTGGRGWNFAGWCAHKQGTLCINFKLLLPILSVITVFVFQIFWPKFAQAQFQWSLWVSWIDFGGNMWILMDDLPMASKNLKFIAKIQWSWKEIVLKWLGQTVLVFDSFDFNFLGCEAMNINVFNLFNNFTAYDLCEQNVGFYL